MRDLRFLAEPSHASEVTIAERSLGLSNWASLMRVISVTCSRAAEGSILMEFCIISGSSTNMCSERMDGSGLVIKRLLSS